MAPKRQNRTNPEDFAPDYPPGHAMYEGTVDPELAAKRAYGEQMFQEGRARFLAEEARQATMGYPVGRPRSDEDRANKSASGHKYWNKAHLEEVEGIRRELRSGELPAFFDVLAANMLEALKDERTLEAWQKSLLASIRQAKLHSPYEGIPSIAARSRQLQQAAEDQDRRLGLLVTPPDEGEPVSIHDAATVPYVGPSQARHEPTTVTHTHDHAAFGHPDADDGQHAHAHDHNGDASHDHDHSHADMRQGMSDNYIGRQMQADIGPAERSRLRKQQMREADRRL